MARCTWSIAAVKAWAGPRSRLRSQTDRLYVDGNKTCVSLFRNWAKGKRNGARLLRRTAVSIMTPLRDGFSTSR
jgi:hypothetical protein